MRQAHRADRYAATLQMYKRIATTVSFLALTAALLAACGSSTKTAPGVQLAPGGPTASTQTTASVPPALSKQPAVTVPKGTPPAHLVVKDLIKGTGQRLNTGRTATFNYVGVLYKTRKVFDSSWQRNQPFTTALTTGNVIPGWVQGLAGMRVGGRRELIVPPALAYGKAGQPPTIPANSTLVFVVDLLSVS